MCAPGESERTEHALHRRPEILQTLLESASDGIVIVDDLDRIQIVNASAERMFGYARAELVGRSAEVLLPDRFRTVLAHHRTRYFAAPRSRPMGLGLDLVARRQDGTEFPVEISLSIVDTDLGRLVMAFITDITQRKRAEQRLRTEFAVTQIVAEGLPLAQAVPRFLAALCEGLGWELGEFWRVEPEANRLRWAASWQGPTLDAAEFLAQSRELEFPPGVGLPGRVWTTAEPIWVSDASPESVFLRAPAAAQIGLRGACAFPVRAEERITGVMGFFVRTMRPPDTELLDLITDITRRIGLYIEHKRLEEELEHRREVLQQRERLATLGTLAAGLAHEINNPLGIIASRIELMLTEGDNPGLLPEAREDLEVVQRNVRRVVRLASGLLSFARQAPRDRAPLDLNRAVEETLLLVERQMTRTGVEVRIMLERALPPIAGDLNALQQVMLILLTNAREAMAGPGTVTIETRPAPERTEWVQLVVSDTGPGVRRDALPRIFDPFFTTKPQGTGLGLSLTHGIVQDHGGVIQVESEPGRGTTFILSFPILIRHAGDPRSA